MADFTNRIFGSLRDKLLEDEEFQATRDKRLGGLSPGGVSGTAPDTSMLGASQYTPAMFGDLAPALQDAQAGVEVDTSTIKKSIVGLSRVAEQVINADFSSMDNVRGPRKFALRLKMALRPGYKQEMEAKGLMLKADALTNITGQIAALQQELRMAERDPVELARIDALSEGMKTAAEQHAKLQAGLGFAAWARNQGFVDDQAYNAMVAKLGNIDLAEYIQKPPALDGLMRLVESNAKFGVPIEATFAAIEQSQGRELDPAIKAQLTEYGSGVAEATERDRKMAEEAHRDKIDDKPKVRDPLALERAIRMDAEAIVRHNTTSKPVELQGEFGTREVLSPKRDIEWGEARILAIKARLQSRYLTPEDRAQLEDALRFEEQQIINPNGTSGKGGGVTGNDIEQTIEEILRARGGGNETDSE